MTSAGARAELTHARHLVPLVLTAALVVLLGGAGVGAWLTANKVDVHKVVAEQPVPDPRLTADAPAGPQTAIAWNAPLTLTVADGTLRSVGVVDPDGNPLPGASAASTTWRSTATTLIPLATYAVTAEVADVRGRAHSLTLSLHTTPATRVLHPTLSPGDSDVVGVGAPVILLLDHPVESAADRAAIESRLSVTTVPAVQGDWRWMDNTELHYRGPRYWAAGTRISVRADFHRLQLSGGTWGSGTRTTSYRIGDALVSTVDVTGHTMSVRRNGQVLRVLKVSTGRDKYPTKGGVHLVLEKTKLQVMDSATVGIPRNSPDGYFEKVPFSVRISYGGAFVHSADWSVADQGVRNVSHGCVNLAPADAEWYYYLAKRGDVVDIVHSNTPPVLWDPGTSDWNIPFSSWAN